MIVVIDTASNVRRSCFNALTEMGHSVVVFHSPDTFINSGAFYNTSLFILGETRVGWSESEALLWASTIRPNVRTLLV
jgi:FixJ family two-component response regulator